MLFRSVSQSRYRHDKLKAKESVPFDTDWLIGQELLVQIVPDTYNGELRDKVQGFIKK